MCNGLYIEKTQHPSSIRRFLMFCVVLSIVFRAAFADENLNVRKLTLEELRSFPERQQYVPISAERLRELMPATDSVDIPASVRSPARIRSAIYRARLSGQQLVDGELELQINREVAAVLSGPLPLGSTNLEGLTILDHGESVPVGATRERSLFVLKTGGAAELKGTWHAAGAVTGDIVNFRLDLPEATTAAMELLTSPTIQVTCNNGLALGPQVQGDQLRWILYPASANRLSFSCQLRRTAEHGSAFPLTSVVANHTVGLDSLTSRWTIGLPGNTENRNRLQFSLPASVRITEVQTNETPSGDWQSSVNGDLQQLNILIPTSGLASTISISGLSTSPSTGSWPLPLLTPVSWSSDSPQANGPVLMPVSQISVTIPRSIEIDGWTLEGIQERDMVPGADDTRVCQLTRFASNASATLHASGNQPRLGESVVTSLTSTGRVTTARCRILVRCEQAPGLELEWPLASGWEPVTVQSLSGQRSLFFEVRTDQSENTGTLRVHLPSPLEPNSSQILELVFQRPDLADSGITDLPIGEINSGRRLDSLLILPAVPASTALVNLSRTLTTPISDEDFARKVPWFPITSSGESEQQFDILGKSSFRRRSNSQPQSLAAPFINYRCEIQDGTAIQTTRFTFNESCVPVAAAGFLLPSTDASNLKWTINGQPCTPVEADQSSASGQQLWMLPPNVIPTSGQEIIVVAETSTGVAPEMLASIVLPDSDAELRGQIELSAPADVRVTIEGLQEIPAPRLPGSGSNEVNQHYYRLPSRPNRDPLRLRIGASQRAPRGETISSHVFHILDERTSELAHEVLAVSRIRRTSEENSLPLFIDPGLRPFAIVDGSHVQLVDTEHGISVPLPSSKDECDVVLVWNEPSAISLLNSSPLTIRQVFEQPGQSQQTTHHFLVAPELELKSPGLPWSTSAPADAAEMLGRLVATQSASGSSSNMMSLPLASQKSAPLGFLTRWKLFSSIGYQHRTVADSSPNTNSALVYITSLNLRRALMYGVCIISVTAGLIFLTSIIRHRLSFSIVLLLLSIGRYFNISPLFDAVLAGWFWGWTAILVFALVISTFRVRSEPITSSTTSAILRNTLLLLLTFSAVLAPAHAQESPSPTTQPSATLPDVIELSDGLSAGPELLLKKELFDRWNNAASEREKRLPDVLITACSTKIHVHSRDSAEATLIMDVAAVTSSSESQLVVPLQGCRVVGCRIDGAEVLPSAGPDDTIIVPVPASVLIPARTIEASENPDGTIAAPAPAASWDVHRVECRLRPVVQSEFSGLQLRLPALPSHRGTVSFDNSNGLIQTAYVHTGTTPFEWKPDQPEVDLGSLLTSTRIDVRIFTESEDTELRQTAVQKTAQTKLLAICDATGSQLGITCVCRISDWNPLGHRVTVRIPPEFELRAVSSPQFGELYWSRIENGADIELYGEGVEAFDLEIRLESRLPVENGLLQIPVESLIQIENCRTAPQTVIAVRSATEFANRPTIADGGRNEVSFLAVQEDFGSGSWLRRSDALFRVDTATQSQTIRLVPRTSTSTARVNQTIDCGEQELNWTLTADIETTIRPLFRHTISVAPGVEITDVQVVALEANRLDRWHQRNNQLLIQLREATIGTYKITIQGRQKLNSADTEYRVGFPQLKDMQILEFSLTLRDRSDSGFLIADTGEAVPDQLLEKNQILTPGTDFRFQVVDESAPLLLRRRKALPRNGLIATFRDPGTTRLLIHFDDFGNIEEPRLPLASGILSEHLPAVKIGDQLTEAQSIDGELRWLKPEAEPSEDVNQTTQPVSLTLMWSFPTPTDAAIAVSELIPLPQFPFPVEWQDVVVITTDDSSPALPVRDQNRRLADTVPGLFRAFNPELPETGLDVEYFPADELVGGGSLRLPSENSNQLRPAETRPQSYVFCDTILRAAPHESVFAETEYTIFCSQTPGRQMFEIPAGITVTRIDSDSVIRWENPERTKLSIELESPVSEVRFRWLGHRSNTSVFSSHLVARIPQPLNAEFRHLASLYSLDVRMPFASRTEQEMSPDEFSERMVQYLREGYLRTSGSVSSTQAEFRELGERAQRLYERLKTSRELFVDEVYGRVSASEQGSVRRFDLNTSADLKVTVPRLPSPSIMLPYIISVALVILCLKRRKTELSDTAPSAENNGPSQPSDQNQSPTSLEKGAVPEIASAPLFRTGESDVADVPAPPTVVAPDTLQPEQPLPQPDHT